MAAPIGEVVRTRIDGQGSGPIFDNLRDLPLANDFASNDIGDPDDGGVQQTTEPIEIDLVNGDGDIDLTNGLDDDAGQDIDLTGTTAAPAPDLEDQEPPTLFAGYDDVEYDPSQYEYEEEYDTITRADELVGLLGVNGINSGAPNFGIPGTQHDDDDGDEPYSDSGQPRRGKDADARFVPAEYVDDDDGSSGPGEFLEYTELLSEGQALDGEGGDGDEDVAFISVPLKIEELGGVTKDSRNWIKRSRQPKTIDELNNVSLLLK